jgi:hypothetical protein
MDELRVPKRRTPVEIQLRHGVIHRFAVFLGDFAHDHSGPERLSDLLNDSGDFVPAYDLDSDSMTFLNREGVLVARLPGHAELEVAEQLTLPTEHDVEIVLEDGARLRGLVSYVLPPDHSRLIDFLNDAPLFFRLFEQTSVALINKRHVASVALVEQ